MADQRAGLDRPGALAQAPPVFPHPARPPVRAVRPLAPARRTDRSAGKMARAIRARVSAVPPDRHRLAGDSAAQGRIRCRSAARPLAPHRIEDLAEGTRLPLEDAAAAAAGTDRGAVPRI